MGVHRKFVGCWGVGECPKKSNIEWVIVYKGGSGFGYFEDVRGGGRGGWKERGGGVFEGGVDTHGTVWPPLKKSDFSA